VESVSGWAGEFFAPLTGISTDEAHPMSKAARAAMREDRTIENALYRTAGK